MDRATRARVDSLLYEVRSWESGESMTNVAVEELARRFRLDPLMVHRLLESEGVAVDRIAEFEPEEPVPEHRRRVTAVLTLEEIARARRRLSGDQGGD